MSTKSKNIEDTYPLSPMQEGLLFHSLYAPTSGVYVTQVTCILRALDVSLLERAWQQVVARHPILRTAFVWKNLEKPIQVVGRQVGLPLERQDWRGLSAAEQQDRFAAYLQADRSRGFEFSRAPLMRLGLFQVDDDSYRLVWSHHHILLDGWSIRLLFKEVLTIYEGLRRGQNVELPLRQPYREYIAWLQRQSIAEAEGFWRQALRGFTAPTSLGVARQAGNNADSGPAMTYEEERLELSEAATADLQALARQYQLTLNTLVQGALALLLSRYSGEEDVVFGAVVSGRPPDLAGVESMVGLFVNTLPARVPIRSGLPVSAWLREFQAQQAEMRRYEYSPLIDVQGWSEVPRGLPMFDTLYAFENYPADPAAAEHDLSLEVSDFHVVEKVSYPLTILAGPGATMTLKALHDGSYDAATIRRMLGHLQSLLAGFVADPEQRVADVPLVTAAERQQLLVDWNENGFDYPRERCMHQLVEAQVARSPEATALVFADRRLSYRELNRRANQLAHYLRQLGVGPEVLVGVCLDRSPEMVVAMLGILKAGGAYVPLDPAYPRERLAFILEDTQAPVLLTQQRLVDTLFGPIDAERSTGHAPQVVRLDTDWETIAAASPAGEADLDSGVTADNLAYVIYTSGSTGRPKGVAIEHRNAGALIHWARQVFTPDELSGVLASTSICFDLSVFELFVTLSWGGKVILAENALQLPALPAAEEVTLVNTVPSAMAELMRLGGLPRSVCTVNLAGEPLQTRLVNQIYGQETVRRVYDLYGPSEDTTYSTFALRQAERPATIGRPIANTQVYLLDRHLNPAPVGVIGQLYIGGEGVVRGYLERPDLTAERFIPNPFSDRPGARLYDTGDLARYRPDGNLEFLGRKDYQVKIRGFRIELGEIEATLHRHPDLQDAVVVARAPAGGERASGEKQLVAYVVPRSEPGPAVSDLRRFILEKLPDYMVPSVFVTLDALPLTPNGKVNRKALPDPDQLRSGPAETFVAPRDSLEELLAELWAGVLGVEAVGVHDNFFELGGHSLLATRLVSRVRDAFEVDIPLAAVFEAPTVAGLAGRVEAAKRADTGVSLPPLQPVPRDGELPLSFAQQRLWFLDQLTPGDYSYNIPAAVRLRGPLDVAALAESLNEMVRRHEVLRTTFTNVSGRPRQVIAPAAAVTIPRVDLTALAEPEREARLRQLATEEAQRPFDLATGPLFRTILVQLGPEEHALLFTMHHIISDGWSIGVLIDEFAQLYQAFSQGQPSPLPPLAVQYADFAHWQREWLQADVQAQQLAYWKRRLTGSPPSLDLPTDRPRPKARTFRGAARRVQFSPELSEALRALSRREGATLFMTLLAAFQTLLHRYSGQDDILVGSPIAGRTRSELENLIGFFVNTLVLRTGFTGAPTFRQVLRQVRKATLDAYAHQDLPFEQLVDALQPDRALSHSPLFQVMFVLQNAPRPALELPGLTLESVPVEGRTAKFDLTLALTDTGQGLVGSLEYNVDLFDAATISRLVAYFTTLLEGIVADPEQPVADLPLLGEEERRRLVADWNETRLDFPADHRLHALFEAQVERTPEALALIFDGAQLTYRQLNERANRLARYLRRLGVGPEAPVGICLERSVEMVVGILGVLKAGGAYVPLDPSYPPDRLAFMLEDAQMPVLLTQQRLLENLPLDTPRSTHHASRPTPHAPRVICLDADWERIAQERDDNLASGVTPENLAYVIYTSGSTGRPKGVVVPHRAIGNHMLWLQDRFGLGESDRYLQKTPFSFDASIWEFYAPLMSGGRLIMAHPGGQQDSAYLARTIAEHGVTILQLVPSLLRVLLEEPAFEQCTSLRRVFCGGEPLPAELQERFQARLGAELHNLYGPTEAAIDVTHWPCQTVSDRPIVPIGRPIANTQIYVLDARLQPAPVGVPGELYIGGANLARGYHRRPDLTAERFVPNPFSAEPGARLYRTGDLARYLPDGNIEFLGRIDHQVKVRGFRIELGEIEAVLSDHPGLRQAVVEVWDPAGGEGAPGDARLVAYVVAATGDEGPTTEDGASAGRSTVGELRSFLRERLPEYMVPGTFVFLEELPLTPSGKVDRRALPAPDQARPDLEAAFVAPRTPTETALAGIWSELLGVDQIGVNDNFFELGGHSLLATQVISRVREALGAELPLRSLFETPRIADLAAAVDQLQIEPERADGRIDRLERGERGLEELVAELEQLSDEEVQALLAEEMEFVTGSEMGND